MFHAVDTQCCPGSIQLPVLWRVPALHSSQIGPSEQRGAGELSSAVGGIHSAVISHSALCGCLGFVENAVVTLDTWDGSRKAWASLLDTLSAAVSLTPHPGASAFLMLQPLPLRFCFLPAMPLSLRTFHEVPVVSHESTQIPPPHLLLPGLLLKSA